MRVVVHLLVVQPSWLFSAGPASLISLAVMSHLSLCNCSVAFRAVDKLVSVTVGLLTFAVCHLRFFKSTGFLSLSVQAPR